MSDDLISRSAAIEAITAQRGVVDKSVAKRVLAQLPSAQPERKNGKWKNGYCSECGYNWGKDALIASVPNFCPNCGAEMVKVEDDDKRRSD